MENIPVSVLIDFINEIDQHGLLTTSAKRDIWNCGIKAKFGEHVLEYLKSSHVDENTFEDGTAAEQVLNVLIESGIIEDYLEYIDSNPQLVNMPSHGNFIQLLKLGNLITKPLLQIEGKEGGRGVGKGEVFLASLFNDVAMMVESKGDLNWNGLYLEVKGSSARLGGRGVEYTDFDNSPLGVLASGIDDDDIGRLVVRIAQNNPSSALDALKSFIDVVYPDSDDFIESCNVHDDVSVRACLTKSYFSNYINDEKVDRLVFINTKKSTPRSYGNYRLFSKEEMSELVDANQIGCKRIKVTDLYPTISAPKIK